MSGSEKARILVVDDDEGMRRAMRRILAPQCEVEEAANAGEARDRLARSRFDVAVVDIQLGGDGDGYAVCAEIRRESPSTDVILMTGSITQSDEKLFRSLEEGAFYFLFKPFERRVLRALLDRCLRLQRERKAKESYARELADDLEKARRFQRSLLPAGSLRRAGWHVEGRFEPCEGLGGDFYFFLVERTGDLCLGMVDIVGHGVSAAMYAGMLRSTIDAIRRIDPEPRHVAAALREGIDFLEPPRFATLFYGLLAPDGRLRYFNAGHPPALLLSRQSDPVRLDATGPLLTTAFPDLRIDVRETVLAPGDRVLLYTDGVFEARSPDGHEWGIDGLSAALGRGRNLDPTASLDDLLAAVRRHGAGRPLDDDATLLLLARC